MEKKFVVKVVSLADIFDLRHRVLMPGKPKQSVMFEGDYELFTLHFGLFEVDDTGDSMGEPLCCASFVLTPVSQKKDAYRLRGMATDEAWQSKGLGKMLLDYAECYIVENKGIKVFWCDARSGKAVKFYYEKAGWRCFSDEFEVKGVGPHHKMMKEVA